jgi:hypothetical protein
MKLLKYISVLILSFLLFSFQIKKDSASVSLQRNQMVIGEQIKLTLQFYYNTVDNKVVWPEFDNFITNEIEIIDKSDIKTIPLDSTQAHQFLMEQDLIITSFDPNTHTIPSIEFQYQDSIYNSMPLTLVVNSVTVDTASKKLFDIYPIYDVEYPVSEQISDAVKNYWYYFVILALIVIIILLYIRYKNRPKELVMVQKVKLPPHVKALQVLNELKKQEAWKKENKKEYYSNLTDTVREYLEERFGIQALEKTTREIINDLKYTDISVEDKHFLREILKQADFVKFAKFKPNDDDGYNALNKSLEFVKRTKSNIDNTLNTKDNVE